MRLFIDSAEVQKIQAADKLGIVDGVTTNPSLISEVNRDYKEVVEEIDSFIDGPISVEVVSRDAEDMVREARIYDTWGEDIAVKIPMTRDGMIALSQLADEGIDVNVTLVFSPVQALFAANNGARFVSPFLGRVNDIGHDGFEMVGEITEIFEEQNIATEILVASVRNTRYVKESAKMGADVITVPPWVFDMMLDHPLTDEGLNEFLDDWGDRENPARQADDEEWPPDSST